MVELNKKYSYDRFGSKGVRVGQAVADILSQEQPEYTVEDILDQFGKDYLNMIRKLADDSKNLYESPYFILSLLKKDLGQFEINNVLKHSARPFQLKPSAKAVADAHPGSTKTLFEVDARTGEINLVWTFPSYQECVSVLKNPNLYDQDLVKYITAYAEGKLD